MSKPAVAERADRAAHLVGARAALEHLEQVRLEALRAERDAVDSVLAQQEASAGVIVSGLASTVVSAASGSPSSRRASASGSVKVGVPPPRKTVSTSSASKPRSSSSSASSAST